MMVKPTGKDLQQVVDWCNEHRVVTMPEITEMPKGKCRSKTDCPIAKATGWAAGSFTLTTSTGLVAYPDVVRQFVTYFDRGYYPELQL